MTDQPRTAAGRALHESKHGAPNSRDPISCTDPDCPLVRKILAIEAEAVEAEAKSCSFRCDGESRHDGPHFFYYDGPQLIGLLEEINAEPLDVDRGEFPDAP